MNRQTLHNWDETQLWSLLLSSGDSTAQEVCATLRTWLPDIQAVLGQADTAPTDFTLHDAQHAFRVAERMGSVVPKDVLSRLSAFDLSLLLLSAYLHDIGMTPEQGHVRLHHQYLLTGQPGSLSTDDMDAFQLWLDDQSPETSIPIGDDRLSAGTLALANELITHYCRWRHNDWSESWIRNNSPALDTSFYMGCTDDLILLCRSHHYDYEELKKSQLDPRPVPHGESVVHLRYLACVLRIADILDLDPERTPSVVFRHRGVAAGSVVYWQKDHAVTVTQHGEAVTFSAYPSEARIHRALELTAQSIGDELSLCHRLATEYPFEHISALPDVKLPHRWQLRPNVHVTIKPQSDAYVYINGTFRPDTDRLLQLLGGTNLYGRGLVAVRELIQNAFDAVREQIALERLRQSHPHARSWESDLGRLHYVVLTVSEDDHGTCWLSCRDDGIGLTRRIIENDLLVSGAATRSEFRQLQRRCGASGFDVYRSGEFGIGVLSYFMVADRIEIETLRSQDAPDSDATGWCFVTEGVGSFGELRPRQVPQRGTTVRLRLKESIGEIGNWCEELREYLSESLVRVPCNVELKSESPLVLASLRMSCGWQNNDGGYIDAALERIEHSYPGRIDVAPEYVSEGDRADRAEVTSRRQSLARAIRSSLRWVEIWVGELPGSLGLARVCAPVFQLVGGGSICFMDVQASERGIELRKLVEGAQADGFLPKPPAVLSWHGTSTSLSERMRRRFDFTGALVQVDWLNMAAGDISVSRNEIVLSEDGKFAMSWLKAKVREALFEYAKSVRESPYSSLMFSLARENDPECQQVFWKGSGHSSDDRRGWEAVRYPAVLEDEVFVAMGGIAGNMSLSWKGEAVWKVPSLRTVSFLEHPGSRWALDHLSPERVIYSQSLGNKYSVIGLWGSASPVRKRRSFMFGDTCLFPHLWRKLVLVHVEGDYSSRPFAEGGTRGEGRSYWNANHRLVLGIDPAVEEWVSTDLDLLRDPLRSQETILSTRERAVAWLLSFANALGSRLHSHDNLHVVWQGLAKNHKSFLEELWRRAFCSRIATSISDDVLSYHQRRDGECELWDLSLGGCHCVSAVAEIESILGVPTEREWLLTVDDANSRESVT